ncbi:hypothetical protein [Spirulina sp. 06S082]|uniref:hypothetical protein n=1 Tax=Spirulina sp. 06S082 TaxID=3110248 RepID=UPI002B208A96|nr:hypothetical protein [Spirulina sp. 06S082]MEA5472121.1 hypothetical protein [Spirulina sp. 06S082]
MKLTQRLVALLSVILVCIVGGGLFVLTAENARAQTSPVPQPELTAQIPINPSLSVRSTYNPETAFGDFAWKEFVALNWPADCNGLPLQNKSIGEAPDAPRVWEFYNVPDDIFLPDGQNPSPVLPIVPPACQTENTTVQRLGLRLTEAAGEVAREEKTARLARAAGTEVELRTDILLPDRKALIDQAGNYVVNEIRINPMEVNQIVDNQWYSADNLAEFNDTDNPFALVCSNKTPDGIYEGQFPCLENEDVGAIELKTAWMVLPNPVPDEIKSTYYTTTRTFLVEAASSANGEEQEVTVPVALIGFHIVQKTSQQAWSWATFEHLDNAPDAGNLPTSGTYNLYNPNCEKKCKENRPYAKEPYLWRAEFPHAVTLNKKGKIKQQKPSQITRLVPITGTAKSLNSEWKKALKQVDKSSIWQNYQLIGTQWLGSPAIPYDLQFRDVQPNRSNKPSQLANVALEPYVQKTETGSSCIACHTFARLPKPNVVTHADFSFLINAAEHPSGGENAE